MKCLVDSLPGVRADHQAPNTCPIAKLRVRICGSPRWTLSFPRVLQRRIHVVVPAAPVIPGHKDRRLWPELALPQVADAVGGPFASELHRLLPRISPVGWMLRKLDWTSRRVDPAHTRQIPGGRNGI